METRRFYTSPVNHHHLDRWKELSTRLERAVRECAGTVSVELGQKPIFGYGTDAHTSLEAESRWVVPPRHVRIDLWSSIVFYEAIAITFGSGITEREASAITTRLEGEELFQQAFLREVRGRYDIDTAQVYGYDFRAGDLGDDIAWLLEPFDTPLYVGSRRCVLDDDDELDREAFEILREDDDTAAFIARSEDAAKRLWSSVWGSGSDGLVALDAGDPADDALVEDFENVRDLRLFLADHPSAGMRVTLARCHMDDSLVVVYTPPEEPEIERPLLFVI